MNSKTPTLTFEGNLLFRRDYPGERFLWLTLEEQIWNLFYVPNRGFILVTDGTVDPERNVYLFDYGGFVQWQIQPSPLGGGFGSSRIEDGLVYVRDRYAEYLVDSGSGSISPTGSIK